MRCRLLGHPAFTGSVAVLAVNDHVLKPAWGSWWTGKLSDVAGVVGMVVLGGVISGRPRWSAMLVGLGFAVVKLVPAVAVLSTPVLGGTTRSDPTDLVALLAIVPAVAFLERHADQPTRRSSSPGGGLVVASGFVAVFAATATSCYAPPGVDGLIASGDGMLIARISAEERAPAWAVSGDGGSVWRPLDDAPDQPARTTRQVCSPSLGCFRTAEEAVHHRPANSRDWRTSFAFSAEQRRRINLRRSTCGSRPEFTALAIVDRPDGEHVVVAMGSQGILHRSPSGEWERRAVLDREPISTRGPSWLTFLLGFPLVVVVLSPVPWMIGRRRGRYQGTWGLLVAMIGGIGLFSIAWTFEFFRVDYVINGPLIAVCSVAVFAVSVIVAVRQPRPPPWPPQPPTG